MRVKEVIYVIFGMLADDVFLLLLHKVMPLICAFDVVNQCKPHENRHLNTELYRKKKNKNSAKVRFGDNLVILSYLLSFVNYWVLKLSLLYGYTYKPIFRNYYQNSLIYLVQFSLLTCGKIIVWTCLNYQFFRNALNI